MAPAAGRTGPFSSMAPCMSSILALSVSDKIDQYGAYAGFASVLGLAILSLLYFAQAREVKRLREWAGRAPERAADVQDRATAAAQQRVIAQRPAQPGVPQTQPVRPAAPGAVPAAATPAGQAAGAAAPAAAAATAAGAATATPPGQQTSVQPAANGAAQSPPTARPGEPLRVPPGTGTPGGTPPGVTRTNYGPDDRDEDEGRSRLAVGGAIAAVVVVLIVIVVLVTGVLGGSDDRGTQASSTLPGATATTPKRTSTTRKPTQPVAAPKPGTYEVSVLNGTTVPGLARGVANRLQNTRFKIGTVTNAATQDRSATLVEFAPGHRAEGDAVAKAIDVNSDSIQALTPGSKTIAGESAVVVVTVGSDQNQTPAAPTGTTTTP
jgi:LytR cell envelope-related transcriptional attenuator